MSIVSKKAATPAIPWGVPIAANASDTPIVHVDAGKSYRFESRGTWIDWFIPTDAGGYDSRLPALFNLWPEIKLKPLMAMCGRLKGDDGRTYLFVIGRGREWTAPVSGELSAFANDITLLKWFRAKNSGTIDLLVSSVACACPPSDEEAVILPENASPLDMRDAAPQRMNSSGRWLPPPSPQSCLASLFGFWRHLVRTLHRTEGILFISLMVLSTLAILGCLPQGQDLMSAVTEDNGLRAMGWLTIAVAFLSLQAWFWPRRVIEANFGLDTRNWELFRGALTWWPRLLGLLPYITVIVLILLHPPEQAGDEWFRALGMAFAGLMFFTFVVFRRKLARAIHQRGQGAVLDYLGLWWPILSPLASFALLVSILLNPAFVGQSMGPAAIVIFAVAGFIPLIALLSQAGAIFHLPTAFLLIVWGVVWSPCNDDQHTIGRRAFGPQPPIMAEDDRPTLSTAYAAWRSQAGLVTLSYEDMAKAYPDPDGKHSASSAWMNDKSFRPLIIVASEGGASRAGYWTALVLDELNRDTKGVFARQTFAISSISGGSLGAIGWVKALQYPSLETQRLLVRRFTGGDQLSPAFADSLFPSVTQRLIPAPVLADGAEGLERGFERSWYLACGLPSICGDHQGLDQPFLNLWPGFNGTAWRPLIFVGGTIEETGRRILTGPVRTVDPADHAFDAEDFYDQTRKNISQSTAITNGARFPWISPPGVVHKRSGNYHIVDGGYFDASGIEAARELAVWIDKQETRFATQPDAGAPIKPIILVINYEDHPREEERPRQPIANDILGPLVGLYASRDGHQAHMLRGAAPADSDTSLIGYPVCTIKLRGDDHHDLPLDWVLSSRMRRYADQQVEVDQPRVAIREVAALLHVDSPLPKNMSSSPRAVAAQRSACLMPTAPLVTAATSNRHQRQRSH